MYCKRCGKYVPEGKKVCPFCGESDLSIFAPMDKSSNDCTSLGYAILSFFLPLVGLTLYIVWKEFYPMRASSCAKGVIASILATVIVAMFATLITVSCMGDLRRM